MLLTITDKHAAFGEDVFQQLLSHSIRVEKDFRNESLRLKIREAQLQKIPYMVVIGDKEVAEGGVSPRLRSGENLKMMPLDEFISLIKKESHVPQ
jgi:threonyl-tRNA synthetase